MFDKGEGGNWVSNYLKGIKQGFAVTQLHFSLNCITNMTKHSENESSSDTDFSRSDQETDYEDEKKDEKRKKKKVESSKKKEASKKPKPKTPPSRSVKDSSKKRKVNEEVLFDQLTVDVDFSNENVDSKRIKLSQNLMIETKVVQVVDERSKSYSYPALVFLRKSKDGKVFEFNVPTILSHKLCEAVRTLCPN